MRYVFGFLCVCALGLMPLVGCSETADDGGDGATGGDGGSAGTGGTAGSAGTGGAAGTGGGGGVAITPGLYSSSPRGTLVCLFVNQDGTKLVADDSCPWGPEGQPVAFRLTSIDPDQGSCAIYYPVEGDDPQEIPIVDGGFEIETTQTDGIGEYTIRFSGEFNENGTVSGVGTHSRDCPTDRNWSAGPGCCSQCQRDGWCE